MIICIEGVNGSGKTYTAKAVAKELGAEYVRFPGNPGNSITEGIRNILQNNSPKSEYTNLMLYFADMAEWFANKDPNKLYIHDRSFISTLTYQCNLGNVDRNLLNQFLSLIGADQIEIAVLLTCGAEEAVRRLNMRKTKTLGNYKDRNEEFYASVQHAYLEEFYRLRRDMITTYVDTTRLSKKQMVEEVQGCLKNYIG